MHVLRASAQALVEKGLVRAIGVSNFSIKKAKPSYPHRRARLAAFSPALFCSHMHAS